MILGLLLKQALEMALLIMVNILKSEEQLTTEYVKTTAVALLYWSQWHSSSLGRIHYEERGQSLLSRFSAHCARNIACTSIQQSSYLTPAYTTWREKGKGFAHCAVRGPFLPQI